MKRRLISEALRVLIFVYPVLYLIVWTLALPYLSLDWFTRRDHLEEFRTLFLTRRSWAQWRETLTQKTVTL